MATFVRYREAMDAPVNSILVPPAKDALVEFPAEFGKRFAVVIDTEEEFDWTAPFDRTSTAVTHVDAIERAQSYFAAAGVVPLYVIDWPIASDRAAQQALGQWLDSGSADIGAHLHPWVNPPHDEPVTDFNSYAGNLPETLERAKLMALRDHIATGFGRTPVVYRAGRYGVGPNSERILLDLGFRVDTSVRSRFDYRHQYGPDFRAMPLHPWCLQSGILELPLSTAWTGFARSMGDRLYPLTEKTPIARGALSRSGALQRIPLTPEGVPLSDALSAIDALLADGLRLLMFSFHSPTLAPGHTPYARDAADVAAFYYWWDGVLKHLAAHNVHPASMQEIMQAAGIST